MPIGLRGRIDVVDVEGPMPLFTADVKISQGDGEELLGW